MLKEKARAYFSAVNNYDAAMIEQMVDENYIQHNPFVPTGRAAFVSLLPKLKSFGSKIKNIRMLQDGQHIIMHHKWENAQPFGHDSMAAFHIIRFDSNGLIAEHWSVMTKDICSIASGMSLTDGSTQIKDIEKTNENRIVVARLFTQLIESKEVPGELPDFMQERLVRLNLNYQKQHKVFAEGNFVLSISEANRAGVPTAVYDLIRIEENKIAEHWAVLQEIPKDNLANSNTMFGF